MEGLSFKYYSYEKRLLKRLIVFLNKCKVCNGNHNNCYHCSREIIESNNCLKNMTYYFTKTDITKYVENNDKIISVYKSLDKYYNEIQAKLYTYMSLKKMTAKFNNTLFNRNGYLLKELLENF